MASAPNSTTLTGGVAGAVVVIIAGLVKQFADIEITATFGAALSTVLTFVAQYFMQPEAPSPAVRRRRRKAKVEATEPAQPE